MHIGFITSEFPHPEVTYSAGIGTSLKNLVDSLLDFGCRVSLFVYDQETDKVIQERSLSIHLISWRQKGFLSWYFKRKSINSYVQGQVTKQSIDLIECPDWTGIYAFMKFSCPCVVRLHGSDGFFCHLEGRHQKPKNRLLEKIGMIYADAIISPNLFTLNATKEIFAIKQFKREKIIKLGVDVTYFKPPSISAKKPNTVYYIGTIIRKKGVFDLASMFNELVCINKDSSLCLIGNDAPDILTGSESTWRLVQSEFSKEALAKVTYLGKISYDQVKDHLEKAEVCVFPSFAETTGMVTLEAMAMGKAVVTSQAAWSKEILEDQVDGMRVQTEVANKFAESVNKLLIDKELSKKIGENARVKIQDQFNVKKTVLENLQFYKELVKR